MYFITGATGFIGGRLCRLVCDAGKDVVGFARQLPMVPSASVDEPGLRFVLGNVCDRQSLAQGMVGARYCLHLAGLAKPWLRHPHDYYRVNLEGTRNVLDAAIDGGVERFVFVSTAGVYRPVNSPDELIDETFDGNVSPRTSYDRSKMAAQELVKEYADAGRIDAVVVNPSRVYGPGRMNTANAITQILRKILLEQIQILPASDFVGNYVFVDDVVSGIVAALERGVTGRSYILGGSNLAWNELIELMHRVAERPTKVWRVGDRLLDSIAVFQDLRASLFGIKPRITREFVRKYRAHYPLSCQRAIEELGYRPTSAELAMEQTVRWLRGLN